MKAQEIQTGLRVIRKLGEYLRRDQKYAELENAGVIRPKQVIRQQRNLDILYHIVVNAVANNHGDLIILFHLNLVKKYERYGPNRQIYRNSFETAYLLTLYNVNSAKYRMITIEACIRQLQTMFATKARFDILAQVIYDTTLSLYLSQLESN